MFELLFDSFPFVEMNVEHTETSSRPARLSLSEAAPAPFASLALPQIEADSCSSDDESYVHTGGMKRRRPAATTTTSRVSRVGDAYQARIRSWNNCQADARAQLASSQLHKKTEAESHTAASSRRILQPVPAIESRLGRSIAPVDLILEVEPVWLPNRISDADLDAFFAFASERASYSSAGLDDARVYDLLHRCQGDCDLAMRMLSAPVVEIRDAEGHAAQETDNEQEDDDLFDDDCCVCGNGGELFCCDHLGCARVYHADCLGIVSVPDKFICPVHQCVVCKASVTDPARQCAHCPNAFCDVHLPEAVAAARNSSEKRTLNQGQEVAQQSLSNNSKTESHVAAPASASGPAPLKPTAAVSISHAKLPPAGEFAAARMQYLCPPCASSAKAMRHTERIKFLHAVQRVLSGQETHVDASLLLECIADHGGIGKLMAGSHWKVLYNHLGLKRAHK